MRCPNLLKTTHEMSRIKFGLPNGVGRWVRIGYGLTTRKIFHFFLLAHISPLESVYSDSRVTDVDGGDH